MEKFSKIVFSFFPVINTMPSIIKIMILVWFFITGFILFMFSIYSGIYFYKNYMTHKPLIPKKITYLKDYEFVDNYNKYKNDIAKLDLYFSSISLTMVDFEVILNKMAAESNSCAINFNFVTPIECNGKAYFNTRDKKPFLSYNKGDKIHFTGRLTGLDKSSIIVVDAEIKP